MRFLVLSLLFATACTPDDRPDDRGAPDAPPVVTVEPGWLPISGTALAADDQHLYVGGATLDRAPLAGGAPETLYTVPPVENGFAEIADIYLGPQDIVFVTATLDSSLAQTRSLLRIPKAGGPVTTLATSQDQRAFLGATIDGDNVYFTTFTSILRVPLAGGATKFVGESPNSVRYWCFSPTIVGDQLIWAEDAHLYAIAKSATNGDGAPLASLPGVGRIIGTDGALVVALSSQIANQGGPESFVEVDPTTGATTAPIAFGRDIFQAIATDAHVWAAGFDGLLRVDRASGAAELVTQDAAFAVAASADAVFVATSDGITRVAR